LLVLVSRFASRDRSLDVSAPQAELDHWTKDWVTPITSPLRRDWRGSFHWLPVHAACDRRQAGIWGSRCPLARSEGRTLSGLKPLGLHATHTHGGRPRGLRPLLPTPGLLGAPTAGQWPWTNLSSPWLNKELGNVSRQSLRQTVQETDGRVLQLPLQAAHIRSINARVGGERFLRKPLPDPQTPKIPSYQLPPVHRRRRPSGGLINHGI
jgi:hypothetical protein